MAVAKKASGGRQAAGRTGSPRKSSASKKVTTNHKSSSGKGTSRKAASSKKGTGRKAASASGMKGSAGQRKLEAVQEYQDHQAFEVGITLFVLGILAVICYLSYFGLAGKVGTVIGGLIFGIFGWLAWFLPCFLLIGYVFYLVNQGDRRVPRRMFSFGGIVLTLMGLSDLIFGRQIITEYYISNHVFHKGYFDCMYLSCHDVVSKGKFNGGLLGRAVAALFSSVIGKVGAVIVIFALLLLFLYIFYGVEMMGVIRRRNARREEMAEIREEIQEEEAYREPSYRVFHTPNKEQNQTVGMGLKPAPELARVPKVQSFDLQELNERLDRLEMDSSGMDSAKREKQKSGDESKRQSRKEARKGVDSAAVEIKVREERNASLESELEVQEERSEKLQERESREPEIPIYRNELQEKFGNKKGEKKLDSPMKIVRDPQGFGSASAFTAFENRKDEGKPEAKDSKSIIQVINGYAEDGEELEEAAVQKGSQEQSDMVVQSVSHGPEESTVQANSHEREESTVQANSHEREESTVQANSHEREESAVQAGSHEPVVSAVPAVSPPSEPVSPGPAKPMASFAHKEEVTDVTPSSQKPVRNEGSKKSEAVSVPNGRDSREGISSSAGAGVPKRNLQQKKTEPEKPQPEKPYVFPPIDLLAKPKGGGNGMSDNALRATATKLQETLKSFHVNVQIGAVTCGPTVTRYEVHPEQGVRVNKITNLADDLKLSLAAPSIRIEAPIPGKAAVGIEVPNAKSSAVSFRELLEGDTFSKAKSPLTFAVGKDIAGKLIMSDIGKMPHVLIAGATGSGKSVCINTLIMSILYKADPNDVKLIMIDPKVVELSVYNGIPHLFCPVVTDPKEAAAALNWAVREMMDRYNKFKELNVRNISGYNEKIQTVEDAASAGYEKMPYLVVIVDEFADLMMVASKEVEDAVCRLAQLARAAGIHLVLATQRPSVNVITGVIKANIPSRVAFSVSSAIDSRTILDKGGAEKLLGKGDMLFFPSGYTEPVRVQGAFVSDKEVSDVVEFLCDSNDTPEYNHDVTEIVEAPQEEEAPAEKKPASDRDEYFADAGRFVIESERAAAGQLQRHFSIGFNRAGRIIDQLHKAGVVGPAEGTKPRKVLMAMEQFEMMLSGGEVVGNSADMDESAGANGMESPSSGMNAEIPADAATSTASAAEDAGSWRETAVTEEF